MVGQGRLAARLEVERQVDAQKAKNRQLEACNASLAAEVRDLKTGTEAIEERARHELGMLRPDEIFYQYVPDKKPGPEPH